MKVLVTGAGGFIGGALVEKLSGRGLKVISLKRAAGDISDPSISKYFDGVDIVYNCAAALAYRKPSRADYWRANVLGVRNLLEICEAKKVRLFVQLSSVAVFDPVDVYSKTKLEGERVVREFRKKGVNSIIIRPTIAYGPGDTRPGFLQFFKLAKLGVMPVIGEGKNFFHTVYIDNLVNAVLKLAQDKRALNKEFTIGDYPCPKMIDVIGAIKAAMGTKIVIHIAKSLAEVLGYIFKPFIFLGFPVLISAKRVRFLTQSKKYEVSPLGKYGIKKQVGLDEGMRQTMLWYKKKGFI